MSDPARIGTRLKSRVILILPLALVLAALAVLWQAAMVASARTPDYVVHVPLPPVGGLLGLPVIAGPPDASRPLVVIDAGHGGHDPGASGGSGLREKDLTLALAAALRDELVRRGRVRVALTRSDDRYLVLDERSGIARRMNADLFISIHADAANNVEASGATIYTLSDTASDSVAQGLAARENRADIVNGVPLGGKSDTVSSILVDLSRREMAAKSQKFAGLVLREGQGRMKFHAEPQREAGFVVLKSLDMPSVLLEAGYISNEADALALDNPEWREGFAATLASAIEIFLASQMQQPT